MFSVGLSFVPQYTDTDPIPIDDSLLLSRRSSRSSHKSSMSLVRNLTRRARAHTRGDEPQTLPRSCSVKYTPGTISRAQISLPTELISTTNMQAMNAPDIRKISEDGIPSSSSASVDSDNDYSSIDRSFLTNDTSSLGDVSPVTPITPWSDNDGKHDFFSSKAIKSQPVPAIPARAPSHSKKAHVEMSRELSVKRCMSPPPNDISEVSRLASPEKDTSHPFGRELAKVAEVAEGFGVGLVDEEQEMMDKGLRKFSVEDYLAEITGQTGGVYEDKILLNPWL